MKQAVTIIGAGGKMGARAVAKIAANPQYQLVLCESNEERERRLREEGFVVVPMKDALERADFVVLAVPDATIGKISRSAIPLMKSGATLLMLDAAAAYIGDVPRRENVNQIIAHPCHPALFEEQPGLSERDYFGGRAQQDIVVALVAGNREALLHATALAESIFAPVGRAHEVTLEQFAMLEPAMSELLAGTAAVLMKHALEEAIARGVPPDAARAFLYGHVQISLAMALGFEKSPLSDAAKIAVDWGMREIIRPDWRKAFDEATLKQAIGQMLHRDA
jgi:ketol-acid reductoisomerase